MADAGASFVSVLIPTYNSAAYLDEALGSARRQSHANLEIVVIDNCSTDTTRDLVEMHAAEDPRIRLLVNESNIGPVGNFRRCLREARGAYVKYLMSDDVLEPTCVERLLEPMLVAPNVVLSSSPRTQVDELGRELPDIADTRRLFADDGIHDGIETGDRVLTRGRNQLGEPSTTLFRNGLVDPDDAFTYDGREYRVLADLTLWLRLLQQGRFAWIPEPLSRFRRHSGQDQASLGMVLTANVEWVRLTRAARTHGFVAEGGQRRAAAFAYLPRAALFGLAAAGILR